MEKKDATYIIRCWACGTANRVPVSSEAKTGKCGACHSSLPPLYTRPFPLSDKSFDAFVQSYKGTLLTEFWAPW